MSAGAPNGAVAISFVPDRSIVDAYLAELRKGFTVPLRGEFVGPTGSPVSTPTSAVNTGPATFANPAGTENRFTFSGPGSYNVAAGPLGGTAGMTGPAGTMVTGGTPAGLQQATQQLGAAATALNQAAQAINSSASRVSAGEQAPPPTPGASMTVNEYRRLYNNTVDNLQAGQSRGGTGRAIGEGTGGRAAQGPFGLSVNGLARYLGAGFLAREGLDLAQGVSDHFKDTALAKTPQDLIQADLAYRQRLLGVPIAGQLVGLLSDFGGAQQVGIERTLSAADYQDQYGQTLQRLDIQGRAATGRATAYGQTGYARQRQEVANQRQAAFDQFKVERDAAIKPTNEHFDTLRQQQETEYQRRRKELEGIDPRINAPAIAKLDADYSQQQNQLQADRRQQIAAIDKRLEPQKQAIEKIAAGQLADINFAANQQKKSYAVSAERSAEEGRRYPRREVLRQSDVAADKLATAQIERDQGFDAAVEFANSNREARRGQYNREDRALNRDIESLQSATRSSYFRAAGNPSVARFNDIYGNIARDLQTNDRPELRGSIVQRGIGQIADTFMEGVRASANQRSAYQFQLEGTQALLNRDQLGAQRAGIESQRYDAMEAIRQLPAPLQGPVRVVANAAYDAQIRLGQQRQNDAINAERFGIQSSTRRTLIAAGYDRTSSGESSGTRSALADVQGIVDSTEQRRQNYIREYGPAAGADLVRDNAQRGRAQLVAFRQQINDSTRGVEVNPFASSLGGVGTVNEQKIQSMISQAFGQVSSESTDLPKGPGAGGGGGSKANDPVAQSTAKSAITLDQIYQVLQRFASKIKVA